MRPIGLNLGRFSLIKGNERALDLLWRRLVLNSGYRGRPSRVPHPVGVCRDARRPIVFIRSGTLLVS